MPSTFSERQFLQVGATRWAYTESGKGEEFWVSFHGYGQHAEVMQRFMEHFRPDARAVHFDMPYHGETTMERESLTSSDISQLLGHLLREKNEQRCSLLAFSLGGKTALKLAELVPGKVERMVLIAPDGLYINPLYRFTANTKLGAWLYARVVKNPENLFAAAAFFRKLGILNSKIELFMHQQLGTERKRRKVYQVWRAFRLITPDLRDIKSKIHRYHIDTITVFGKHDRIIRQSLSKKLADEPSVRTILLDNGHDLTTTEVADQLRKMLG